MPNNMCGKRIFESDKMSLWGQACYDKLIRLFNEVMTEKDCIYAIHSLDELLDDIFARNQDIIKERVKDELQNIIKEL